LETALHGRCLRLKVEQIADGMDAGQLNKIQMAARAVGKVVEISTPAGLQ